MLRITGGKVYDPANNIDGVVKDICIAEGRVVPEVKGGRSVDASGMVVLPGGVDVHSHIAGAALNFARGLTPENYRRALTFSHTPERRAGQSRSVYRQVALGRAPPGVSTGAAWVRQVAGR